MTTVRVAVWQGWKDRSTPHWSTHWWEDEDGGVWAEAQPDICEAKGHHILRVHPGAGPGYFYCVVCGAQGVSPLAGGPQLWTRSPAELLPSIISLWLGVTTMAWGDDND